MKNTQVAYNLISGLLEGLTLCHEEYSKEGLIKILSEIEQLLKEELTKN